MYAGSAVVRSVSSQRARARPAAASRRRPAATAIARRAGRAAPCRPGWWIQNEITLCWNSVICAHSLYGTTTPVFCQWSNTSCGVGGNDFGCGTCVDPAAVLERRVRVDVVRLPESARVGRHRPAADAHLVPHDPRHHEDRGAGEDRGGREQRAPRDAAPPQQVGAEQERQRLEPDVAEDAEADHRAERQRAPPAEALGRVQRQVHGRGREEVVEDLAVHVHVVPDEVRVQCDEQARRAGRSVGVSQRLPICHTISVVATATQICASPTTSQWRPKIQ